MSSEADIIRATSESMEFARRYNCKMDLEIKSRWGKAVIFHVTPEGVLGDEDTKVLRIPEAGVGMEKQ